MSCDKYILFPYVGNKKYYLEYIKKRMPKKWNTYIEPFVGSGVIFNYLSPEKAILSDGCTYLMNIFIGMKTKSNVFYKKVQELYENNCVKTYKTVKKNLLNEKNKCKSGAMYLYLLRTSLFSYARPTKDGKSVVGCQRHKNPLKMKDEAYWNLATNLSKKNVEIYEADFEQIMKKSKKGDLILIDPPYMNEKKPNQVVYNNFRKEDHERLVKCILEADKKGVYIMMFNHNHPYILEKLKGFRVEAIDHESMKTSRSAFSNYKELLFRNY